MSSLFSKPKAPDYPDPQPPATIPDTEDVAARRARRVNAARLPTAKSQTTRNVTPGTIGREYSRGTLG